jgi:hypothetical protein
MKKYLSIPLLLLFQNITAQNIQQISESDIQDITILPGYSFEGENLNNYLGSAADLYSEYGLQKLYVNEYGKDKDTITLQVFSMVNAPSAFGIYSLSVSECMIRNIFGSFSCVTPYIVAAVHGPLFIHARNRTGSQSGQDLCKQLVKLIIDKNPQEVWYAPLLTQSSRAAPFTNTLRYYKGPIGLMKGLPVWSDLFDNINFHMYTMNINTPDYNVLLARIIFPDENTLNSFISKSSPIVMSGNATPIKTSNGLYRSWFKINTTKILFMETNSPNVSIQDFLPEVPDNKWLEGD